MARYRSRERSFGGLEEGIPRETYLLSHERKSHTPVSSSQDQQGRQSLPTATNTRTRYLIPGENGSLEPGERVLNYVWYTSESEEMLDQILTNANGHRHRVTLPAGEIREEVWAKQVARAVNDLPTPFAELVQKTTQPFVQAITDVTSGPPSSFSGKLIFVGDALAAFRPHVACSTNQAALHALLFEKVMTGAMTLQEWENQSLQYAEVTSLLSVVLGNMNQSDFWSLPASVFWFGRAWIMQWIRKRWLGVSTEAPHSLARRIPTSVSSIMKFR